MGILIHINFRREMPTLEEKKQAVKDYYETSVRGFRLRNEITPDEVNFLWQKMNLLSKELDRFYEFEFSLKHKMLRKQAAQHAAREGIPCKL